MRIKELGMWPRLSESNIPLDQALDLKMIQKIEDRIALNKNVKRRKKKLAKILKKIDDDC